MSIFAIGDLHLSTACNKKMDIFKGWEGYENQLVENWKSTITDEDTCVLLGDTSWGMNLNDALADFKLIDSLPGKKVLLKGNHDYWWDSLTKMRNFLEINGIKSLEFLHNNCIVCENLCLCGTRGWMMEDIAAGEQKITLREEGRLKLSLESAKNFEGEKVVFLHYPPVFAEKESGSMIDIMRQYGVKRCYYGHIHGRGHKMATIGRYKNLELFLVSADFLKFEPKLL